MMRKYQYSDGSGYIVTGTDREIRSLYKRMTKREEFVPTFCDFPILSYGKRYGISVTDDENDSYISWFHVVNATTILWLLDDNLLVSEGEGGKMMDAFYKRMREAKMLYELKAVYKDFAQAFVNDEITLEQYNKLRMVFHNAKILKAID